MKKIVSIIMVMSLAIGMIGFNFADNATAAETNNSDTYISEMIMYYQTYQEEANTDIQRLLSELEKVDAKKAEAWREIMNYWSSVNAEGFANIGTVPSDLPNDNSVAIVILGFALNDDGTMKEELIGRLQTGLDIANAYPNSYVVVTGGGTAANNPDVTEGGLMGEWLLAQGLSSDRLIVENKAPDTVGNAENTFAILSTQYPMVKSIVLVTSDYHVPRGCLLYNSKFILDALENNASPIRIISNAGFNTGTNGYETIALQARGLRSVAGISATPTVELSKVLALNVTLNTPFATGNDLNLTVKAVYNTGYEKDVTDLITVTDFDKNGTANQTITISYKENDLEISGQFALTSTTAQFIDTSALEELIATAEGKDAAKYTKNSYASLTAVVAESKAFLESNFTLEQYKEALANLDNEILLLKPRVNLVSYTKEVTSNATKITDGGIAAITDGKTNTYGTFAEPGISDLEIVIELDGYYDLEEIVVRPYFKDKESDYTVRSYFYDLYISEDGENWELVAQHTATGTTNEGNSHPVDSDVNAKYIKIDGTGKVNLPGQDNQAFHLSEVYAYGEEPLSLTFNKPFTSSGADLSASSSSSSTTDKALDGDRSTYWDAGKYSNKPWLDVDLGGTYVLDSVNVITYCAKSDRYYQFEVYASTDGVNYVKVAEKKDDVKTTKYGTTFEFEEPVYATNLKVVGTHNSKNSAFHIAEFRAYGSLATEADFVNIEKQEIQAIVNSTYRSDYTEASWETYLPVRESTLTAIARTDITLAELETVRAKLVAAIDALVVGNPDEKEEGTFRLATFNIWAPNPNHPDVEAINAELLRLGIDYAGIQEVDQNNTRDNRDVIALIADDDYISNYKAAIEYKGGYYGIGQLSSTEILEVTSGSYTKVADEEGRAWMRMLVNIDGKEVAIYNTHLSVDDSQGAGAANMAELLEVLAAETCKYVLVTGDFNATREEMDPLKEDYNLVNGNDGLWYSTFIGDKWSGGLGYVDGAPSADVTSGIDNIVVSRNIEYTNVRVVYNDGLSDHYMLYADFKLLAYEDDLKELLDASNYVEANYTAETWAAYTQAVANANAALENTDYANSQPLYKAALEELQAAIDALVLLPADYSKVDEAISKLPADLSIYTDETVKAVNDAVNAVVEGKDITEQAVVDGYADAINAAAAALVIKPADYSKVDEAISKLPADLSIYTNATVKALEEAVAAVVVGKDITEQAVVDGYADAIKAAVDGLKEKPDTTKDPVVEKEDMEDIFEDNKTQDVVISVTDGDKVVEFTFEAGTMKPVDGKDKYSFKVDLVDDYSNATADKAKFDKDDFVVRINFEYDGKLPAKATITIPVGVAYKNTTLYYYQILADGTLKYVCDAPVDANGNAKVTQDHCSDYVLLTEKVKEAPNTGDATNFVLWFAVLGLGVVAMAGSVAMKKRNF